MAPATLSPECRLVFRSADPGCDPAEYAALAGAVENWPRLFTIAERELATLSIFRGLVQADVTVPADALDAIRKSALQTDLRMQQLAYRLRQSVEGLAAKGIPCLLLKGAAIGALGDPTFRRRPMTDLDILVHREDVQRASDVLLRTGWSVTTNPVYLEMLKDAHHLPHFVDAMQPGVRLELHVSLMPDDQPFAFDEAAMWRDARPAASPFTGALTPSAEHLVLHACLHFAWQHQMSFGAWRTFRAIAELTRTAGFDWDRLVSTATLARAGTACYWSMRLANSLGRVSTPVEILRRLEPPTPEWVRSVLERHVIAEAIPGEGPTSPSSKLTTWLWKAALRPAWSGYVRRGQEDRDQQWVRAYGTPPPAPRFRRLVRHLGNYRAWTQYLFRTLLP